MSSAFSGWTSTVAPESLNCEIGPSIRLRAPWRVCGSPITSKTYGELSCAPVDLEARRRGLDRALGDQAHLAVDLHRLGTGRAELLDGVEHGVDVDVLRSFGDRDADAGSGDGDQARQDAELLLLLLRRGECGALGLAAGLELATGRLELVDLGLGALRGAGQRGEHVDEVLLAVAGEGVVGGVGADLGDRGETEGGQQDATTTWARDGRSRASRSRSSPTSGSARCRPRCRSRRRRPAGRARRRTGREARQAWKTYRRICATLEKIRMPRTTITPVDSCPPTPSLSPR